MIVCFAITDSSSAPNDYKTPYILMTVVFGIATFATVAYIEGWAAEPPFVPFDIFQVLCLKALFVALFFSYGVLGTSKLYGTLYIQNIIGASPVEVVAWLIPITGIGMLLSVTTGYILFTLSGIVLMPIVLCGWIGTFLLFIFAH